MHLTLLAITGASSYSHKGPLRPSKLMGKDKAVPVAVVEISMAARRDNPFDGLDLENATSASQNQKAVCEWSASVRLGRHSRSPRRRDA